MSHNGEAVIRYTVGRCALGRMLLAATDRGICWVGFGDTVAEVESRLRSEKTATKFCRADTDLRDWLGQVIDSLTDRGIIPNLPLDETGTVFQRRVWAELRAIPRGQTRSYSQVAAAVGNPAAVRAVARACATNPVAVLTPCHRVIGADGSLRGYASGLHRKQALLDRERE